MAAGSATHRCFAFVDGQNLFHAVKHSFGYTFPNYDATRLCESICRQQGWRLEKVLFYTGIPDVADNPFWHTFWKGKLGYMGKKGIHIFSRPLRYRIETLKCPHGHPCSRFVGREKGVDVRLALDVVRFARARAYDVALLLTQDQDPTEAVEEVKVIAREQQRWIKVACAFPSSPVSPNRRGVDKTDWIRIDRVTYDTCIDPRDYRDPTLRRP